VPRIKIAIVGLNFGSHIIGLLRDPPVRELFEIVAVCDIDQTRAREVALKIGARPTFDLEQVISDPAIEAIGLFTGPAGRGDLIFRIVRAGKHVITTKPFEVDPNKAADVLAEAHRLGRTVHLNSPSPLLSADLLQVRAWQAKFNLGRAVACRRAVWATYREQADGTWYDDPEKCPVAPILRLGIYCVNDMVRLLGEAEKVTVLRSRLFTGRPTPDNAELGILFKNGTIGSVFASFCIDDGQYYSNSMTLNFENGTIYRNTSPQEFGKAARQTHMSVAAKDGPKRTVIEHADIEEGSGHYQWDAFARAVRGEALPNEVTPREIVAGLKILAAMARADKSGNVELV
jgi:predicted dehydrogenase